MINQVEVKNVYKNFGDVKAVDGVSLEISQGQFFSLLGPSGCGKTTLLRLIAGFEMPNSGDISIDNKSMDGIAPNLRPTNMVFQNYAIFPHLNVEENVAYGLRKKRLSKDEKFEMINKSLELVGLSGLNNRSSNALSGGQKQRVALRHLQRVVGITFILVTHDQEEALTMSDKVAVMFDGKVEQIASPRELYERPSSKRVASFIGTMNFIDAIGSKSGEKIKVENRILGKFELPQNQVSGNHINNKLTLGIRPELISINPRKSKSADFIEGEIEEISYLGETTYYKIICGKDIEPLNVSTQNSFGQMNYKVGEKVKLNIDKDNIVGFSG